MMSWCYYFPCIIYIPSSSGSCFYYLFIMIWMKRFFFRYVVLTWLPHKNQVRDGRKKTQHLHVLIVMYFSCEHYFQQKRSSISIQTYANKGTDFGQSSDRMINDEDRAFCNPWWTENKYYTFSNERTIPNIEGFEALHITQSNLNDFTRYMRIESQQHFHQICFLSCSSWTRLSLFI